MHACRVTTIRIIIWLQYRNVPEQQEIDRTNNLRLFCAGMFAYRDGPRACKILYGDQHVIGFNAIA